MTPTRRRTVGVGILLVAAVAMGWIAAPATAADHPRYTGTFTSMYYNEEGGDVVGDEIRVVFTRKGYQGTLQLGNGEPTELILFDPVLNGDRITFRFTNPVGGDPMSFSGRIDAAGLRGRFLGPALEKGRSIDLKRAPSYWETYRTAPP